MINGPNYIYIIYIYVCDFISTSTMVLFRIFFLGGWDESRKLANIIAQDSTGMKFEVAESYSDHSTWHEKVTVFMCSMGRDTK